MKLDAKVYKHLKFFLTNFWIRCIYSYVVHILSNLNKSMVLTNFATADQVERISLPSFWHQYHPHSLSIVRDIIIDASTFSVDVFLLKCSVVILQKIIIIIVVPFEALQPDFDLLNDTLFMWLYMHCLRLFYQILELIGKIAVIIINCKKYILILNL